MASQIWVFLELGAKKWKFVNFSQIDPSPQNPLFLPSWQNFKINYIKIGYHSMHCCVLRVLEVFLLKKLQRVQILVKKKWFFWKLSGQKFFFPVVRYITFDCKFIYIIKISRTIFCPFDDRASSTHITGVGRLYRIWVPIAPRIGYY